MKEVLVSKDITKPDELYYMYRDLHKTGDEKIIRRNALRYDVTIIRADRLGNEFMKTAGHYHPGDYGELYEVVSGEAWCLLQKPNAKDKRVIEDVILVKAKAQDKIVIPPGYGHILINLAKEDLVTSNWVSSKFSSEYELYKKAHGAAYYIFEDNSGERFEVNPYFKEVAKIRPAKPAKEIKKFGISLGVPMYQLLHREVNKLDFLNNPLKYNYLDVFAFF
jgi:glucose-6-phosphate isomerase